VFRKNGGVEYLLLHYEAGHWDFVKGQVEVNESETETVLRELAEETGITDARFVERFREEVNYFYRRDGETIFKTVAYFLIEAHKSEVKLSYEHVGFEWLNIEEALKRLTFKSAKDVLRKAHAFLEAQGIIEQT
jgi:8-oxo-dGTP pyrophosphatase MutT (NUDIX family)